MNTTNSTVSIGSTGLDFTAKTAALSDPSWQLAIIIEYYFQYAIIAIGVFGAAANALVLYALVEYHLRESKKRAINLLMINQNLLDLSTCVLLIITMSVRVRNIYLTGALGYFLCTILISENASYCTMYASIINLIPQATKVISKAQEPIVVTCCCYLIPKQRCFKLSMILLRSCHGTIANRLTGKILSEMTIFCVHWDVKH